MPRPTNKEELLQLSQKNYSKLMEFVDVFPKEERQKEFPQGYLNRNIRDVLAHLHRWHLMVMEWYQVGMQGEKPEIPAKGYTWRTVPDLNRKIQKEYENIPFKEVRKLLEDSHHTLHKTIEKHTVEELFEKKRYKWTGATSLGAYLISATSSHYDWAFKLIKRCMK